MLAVLLLNRMSARRRMVRRQKPVIVEKVERKSPEVSYCRTCLNTKDLVSIFYSRDLEEKRARDLWLVTGLEIKINDGLSQKICTNCIETMRVALQFRRTSRKAEKSLLSMLSGHTPKKKYSTRISKSLTSPRVKKAKVETDDEYDYNMFGDDFQNDDDEYLLAKEETKGKLKQKPMSMKKNPMKVPTAASYKCSTCNKEFRMKATYKAHMRFHTNYRVCESCGKRCRNNNQLQEHKRARHGLGKIHKCAYCEYSSATKEALTIHERRHTGERPYVCDHCGATFHRRSNLVQHIAIHLPEKNFQCPVCFKWMKSKKLLQVHHHSVHRMNRYSYLCPICQRSFSRTSSVRKHLTKSHGVAKEEQGVIEKVQIKMPVLLQDVSEQSPSDSLIVTHISPKYMES